MTEQKEAQTKVLQAERISNEAIAAWRLAFRSLDGDVGTNGYGILRDPSELRAKLLDAKKHIEDALKHFDGVRWPTDADYDLAEKSKND